MDEVFGGQPHIGMDRPTMKTYNVPISLSNQAEAEAKYTRNTCVLANS